MHVSVVSRIRLGQQQGQRFVIYTCEIFMEGFLRDACKYHKISKIAKITKIAQITKIATIIKITKIANKITKIAKITKKDRSDH